MPTRTSDPADRDEGQHRLAVLIDADNAQPAVIAGLLAEVARYGVASVRRLYGDFTQQQSSGWKKALLKHSIQPVQQFAYTAGKNATDSALIIDAMDLMHTRRFDGFALVSSDSDFTRLAQRLREEGLTVYGFGERKTPDAFVQACDKFVYVEVLRADAPAVEPPPAKMKGKKPHAGKAAAPAVKAEPATKTRPEPPLELIRQAIEEASDEEGWAQLGAVGSYLSKIRPDFDPRLYGHRKLSDLVKAARRAFEVEERGRPDSPVKDIYVKSRE